MKLFLYRKPFKGSVSLTEKAKIILNGSQPFSGLHSCCLSTSPAFLQEEATVSLLGRSHHQCLSLPCCLQRSSSRYPREFSRALPFLLDVPRKPAIVCCFLFICFPLQRQRKLHELMALFYSCLSYNISNYAWCTKGFQSKLHGQMDEWVEGYMVLDARTTIKTKILKN